MLSRLIFGVVVALAGASLHADVTIYVSTSGSDSNSGAAAAPFATLAHARDAARTMRPGAGGAVNIIIDGGTYYLDRTLTLDAQDSGSANAPTRLVAAAGQKVILSGARRLRLEWKPYKNGIWQAQVPAETATSAAPDGAAAASAAPNGGAAHAGLNNAGAANAVATTDHALGAGSTGAGSTAAGSAAAVTSDAGAVNAAAPDAAASAFDQLWINGALQHMARYPNYDPNNPRYGGYAADAISPARIARWSHPAGAFFHALHMEAWGDLHYRITGVDASGNAILEGGWQNNRSSKPHPTIRYVENVFEELDAPGEWFFNPVSRVLYVYPTAGVDLSRARVEAAGLAELIDLRGSSHAPVRCISLEGLTFTQTARTFMDKYDPLLRADWAIHRGGAVLTDGAEDCAITNCDFVDLGGNAYFATGYNRRLKVGGCRFVNIGASAVCFVGDVSAVRSPTSWSHADDWATMDRTPGPRGADFPSDCWVDDCLMHHFGTVEKQVAGVEIDMASRIAVSHCSIYDCPRAGINIGDGCWGGHVIEFCDVFDTVKETGDHGSFNSWGRDRYWDLRGKPLAEAVRELPSLPELDVIAPIELRNNRWRCDHGWDIDLDDGSSNYRITNNLCLHGGIKNREGYDRIVTNNIMVDNTFHPHVWFPKNRGVFEHNIVMAAYRPIGITRWDARIDYNFFTSAAALATVQKDDRTDAHSLAGDPKFLDPAQGDYRVADDSPALKVGFKNFDMSHFGVTSPRLKAEAQTPVYVTPPGERSR